MPKRLIPILTSMIVSLSLSQSKALAFDSCMPSDLSEALRLADVVFAGKAITANEEAWRVNHIGFVWRPPFVHLTEDYNRYRSTFEVTAVWKGDATARTSIITCGGSYSFRQGGKYVVYKLGACGGQYSFRRGEEYIVYANWFKGELHNAWCHRNKPLSAAGEDLLALGEGKPPAPNPTSLIDITGRLAVPFAFLAMFGWVVSALRRKYGVRKV